MINEKLLKALSDLVDTMTGRMDGELVAFHNAIEVLHEAENHAAQHRNMVEPVRLTEDEIARFWMSRPSLYSGEMMLQLQDFGRAIESAVLKANGIWGE
jgi:hypothetical protein